MPYTSRRQWNWAFATGQPFARRWADETPGGKKKRYQKLPVKVAKKAYTADRVGDAGHTGVMIALYPDEAATAAIAVAKGVTEQADALHLTLCYLGDSTEQHLATNKARLLDSIAQFAMQHWTPLSGEVAGVGRFFNEESDGTNAVYVSPDIAALPEMRQQLVDWIHRAGFDYAQNHGFTPHITVAYVPSDAPTPAIRIEAPVRFDRITVSWGDEQYDFPVRTVKEHCTCSTVKAEKIAPGITRIRGNLCNVHGRYGPCDASAAKKPKLSRAASSDPKAQAARDALRGDKKPTTTADPRRRADTPEKAAQRAQQRADVLRSLNIAPDGQAALEALRNGDQPDPAALARGGFVAAGLVEQATDGSYRMTPAGRAMLSAADAGDRGRAGDTISAARDRVTARQPKTGDTAARNARLATSISQGLTPPAAKPKPKKGSGAKQPPVAQPQLGVVAGNSGTPQIVQVGGGASPAGRTPEVLRAAANAARTGRATAEQAEQLVRAGLAVRTRDGKLRLVAKPARKTFTLKHGTHNQASHGRRGTGSAAGAAAYASARAAGASVADARAARRDVVVAHRNQQRIANIDKQLGGHVSPSRRASLQAERARLHADTAARAARTSGARDVTTPAPTVRGRQAPQPKAPARVQGDETRAYSTEHPHTTYGLRHELVDMDDIHASNTATGAINPRYDATLQPRDRSRAASQAQIDQVARQMNPDVLTVDFHRIDAGSPIIDKQGNVLSGNGRTLALQRARELYPEQYAAYKAKVKADAEALGIDPAAVDRMKNPVLVRRLEGDTDKVAFAREANTSGTLRMSPLEQAKVDANVLSDRQMLKLHVGDGQDIDRALRDRANKPFIDDFLKTVPDNERANLLTKGGDLNQMGLYRMKAAIYTKAFPGAAGERMAESMLESLDPDVKTIQNGISAGLPSFSRATSLTRSGQRDPDLDISDDMARVVDTYARIKDNPHLTANTPAHMLVDKYLGQSSMFDRELNPQQERLLRHVDSISKKPTAVRDFLRRYADIVEGQPPPGQGSLFGDIGKLTRDQLYDYLISGGGPGSTAQAGMF
jgi:2'-5' RNA ligase